MTSPGLGPRADRYRSELSDDLPVAVELIGGDIDSGLAVIHDPDYSATQSGHEEMTLAVAEERGATFCCDCFERAWLGQLGHLGHD